jgi:DeoR family myo-inositol catabolism operon transcriptional repressor
MMKSLRSIQIVDILKDRKYCSYKLLMDHFNVSQPTIYRDVSELARQGIIRKVHGGIALLEQPGEPVDDATLSSFSARVIDNIEQKKAIAAQAVAGIKEGDVIFLDSSTTAFYLARELQKTHFSRLTVITNSVLILQEFHLFPANYYLISLGGNFSCQLNSFLGNTAIENLKRLRIDKAFFSGVGITEEGVFTYHEGHAEFLKEVMNVSRERCLLLDSSKFNKSGIFMICKFSELNHIYSDATLPGYA